MYEIYKSPLDGDETIIRNNEDGTISSIPKCESNSDYQAYLASLKQQATLKDK